jgi:DNA-binding MarR family transcriptional regulator
MPSTDSLVLILQEWLGGFMSRSMRGLILYLKASDLSMSQIGALFQINRGRSNVSDLGEGLGISKAAASQMLERLVQQELILRSEDPLDRRVKKLVLTDKGSRLIQQSVQVRQDLLEDLVSTLSEDEKIQITAAVKIMIEKTKQLNHHTEPAR